MRLFAAFPGLIVAAALSAGEPPQPQPQPPKNPPIQITATPATPGTTIAPVATPLQTTTDWTQHIADFQSEDAAKRESATKAFVEGGARGAPVLDAIAKKSPELAKRVADVKQLLEKKSVELYQEAAAFSQKAHAEPITIQGIEAQRQKWLAVAMYSTQQALRQSSFQQVQNLQKLSQTISQAQQQLNANDMQLKGPPVPNPLQRASIQMERAAALKKLQRMEDAQAAAKDAVEASGKDGRLTPGAIKLVIELDSGKDEGKATEELSKLILKEYPRSLEVKFAHHRLVDFYSEHERWDEAIAQAKLFVATFPLDEEAQGAAFSLLNSMMDDAREYARAVQWADWLIETFPLDRLQPEAPKNAAGIYEYVVKDYDKAERACMMLRDKFADLVDRADMDRMLARLKQKKEGKFVKEPQPGDPDVAGVFATFVKAVRARDKKLLGELVPKEEVEEYTELLTDTLDSFVPQLTFVDFELKKVDVDAAGNVATLTLLLHEPDSAEPRETKQKALKEDGKWKIQWVDPDQVEEEAPAVGPQPKKFIAPNAPPAVPAPAPATPPAK